MTNCTLCWYWVVQKGKATFMDHRVLDTQRWLNRTYKTHPGWVNAPETGNTGWPTIAALTRALQIELGIKDLSSRFGETTTSLWNLKIGNLNQTSGVHASILAILSGALWCKGYAGADTTKLPKGPKDAFLIRFEEFSDSIVKIKQDIGLPPNLRSRDVNAKLMASLLSMDAYVRPQYQGAPASYEEIREGQQWLNGKYWSEASYELCPTDGIFSRRTLSSFVYGVQYELGLKNIANGWFGPTTRKNLRQQPALRQGSSGTWVFLAQIGLRFNGHRTVSLSGKFDGDIVREVQNFQRRAALHVSGLCDYTTWCEIIASNGDTDRVLKGLDTNVFITASEAKQMRAAGYTHVGRYLVGPGQKYIRAQEFKNISDAGLRLFPIYQRSNDSLESMSYSLGYEQGLEALVRGRVLGLPFGAVIYFAVDFDPVGDEISGPVAAYFKGVKSALESVPSSRSYRAGVYGTRNVCGVLRSLGLVHGLFVSGMSWGFSGNMGFVLPDGWDFNQVIEVQGVFGPRRGCIDRVAVSRDNAGVDVSRIVAPPVWGGTVDTNGQGGNAVSEFDKFFEWVVKCEVIFDQYYKEGYDAAPNIPTAPPPGGMMHRCSYSAFSILHAARQGSYWGFEEKMGVWMFYTPNSLALNDNRFDLDEHVKNTSTWGANNCRDYKHFAVSTIAYLQWGLKREYFKIPLGDIGGWGLDLLSLWDEWEKEPRGDFRMFIRQKIGSTGVSKFGYADFIADCDAWLLALILSSAPEKRLSEALRELYAQPPRIRLKKFAEYRFGGRKEEVKRIFSSIYNGNRPIRILLEKKGIIPSMVNDAIDRMYKGASDVSTYPSLAQANIMAEEYYDSLIMGRACKYDS